MQKIKDDYAQMLGYKCFIDLLNDCSTLEIDFHINNLIRIENKNGWIKINHDKELPEGVFLLYNENNKDVCKGSFYDEDGFEINRFYTHYKKIS